jgi:hypothetical protein
MRLAARRALRLPSSCIRFVVGGVLPARRMHSHDALARAALRGDATTSSAELTALGDGPLPAGLLRDLLRHSGTASVTKLIVHHDEGARGSALQEAVAARAPTAVRHLLHKDAQLDLVRSIEAEAVVAWAIGAERCSCRSLGKRPATLATVVECSSCIAHGGGDNTDELFGMWSDVRWDAGSRWTTGGVVLALLGRARREESDERRVSLLKRAVGIASIAHEGSVSVPTAVELWRECWRTSGVSVSGARASLKSHVAGRATRQWAIVAALVPLQATVSQDAVRESERLLEQLFSKPNGGGIHGTSLTESIPLCLDREATAEWQLDWSFVSDGSEEGCVIDLMMDGVWRDVARVVEESLTDQDHVGLSDLSRLIGSATLREEEREAVGRVLVLVAEHSTPSRALHIVRTMVNSITFQQTEDTARRMVLLLRRFPQSSTEPQLDGETPLRDIVRALREGGVHSAAMLVSLAEVLCERGVSHAPWTSTALEVLRDVDLSSVADGHRVLGACLQQAMKQGSIDPQGVASALEEEIKRCYRVPVTDPNGMWVALQLCAKAFSSPDHARRVLTATQRASLPSGELATRAIEEILRHVDPSATEPLVMLVSLPIIARSTHPGVRSLRHSLLCRSSSSQRSSPNVVRTVSTEVEWELTHHTDDDVSESLLAVLLHFRLSEPMKKLVTERVLSGQAHRVSEATWTRVVAFAAATDDEALTHWAVEGLRTC